MGDLFHANIGMLKVLGGAIAKRDSDTNIHNYRVTIYAVRLAETAGLKREDIAGLIKGSFLHDVGKIAISDLLLLKPGTCPKCGMALELRTVADGGDENQFYKNNLTCPQLFVTGRVLREG